MSADNDNDEPYGDFEGSVYLIGTLEPFAIKIGFTTKDPRNRLRQLQTGSPIPLRLIGWFPADRSQERELHAKMAPFHIQGEWFRVERSDEWADAMRGAITVVRINNQITGFRREFEDA